MSLTTTRPGVVVFDYAAWSAAYPTLAVNVTEAQATEYFNMATMFLNNSPYSPVRDVARRASLLNLLVSHIATLNLPASQGGNGGAVGRTAAATRGSVSVTLDYAAAPGSDAWFNQTQWGAMFWTATIFLRQFRFIPGRPQRPRICP